MKISLKKFLNISDVWMAVLSAVILLTMLIPYLLITQYIWPCSDDFELSLWTKEAWLATGSIWNVMKQAIAYTYYKYMGWQGAYSSIFLMALQPGIWGDKFYPLGAIFIILGFAISVFVCTYVLIVGLAHAKKTTWVTVTSLVLWYYLLFIMYPEEAFYWWTGASYYTGFLSWGLLLLAFLIQCYISWDKYSVNKKTCYFVISAIAALFIGGGNFPTTLFLIEIVGILVFITIYQRKTVKNIVVFTELALLVALLVSALAPGNSNHVDQELSLSVIDTIWGAIRYGLVDIKLWTQISVIVFMLFLVPYLLQIALVARYEFRYPVIFTIISGGIFLSLYTPIIYTYGSNMAPGRMINIFYFVFILLWVVNTFYWLGWGVHKCIKYKDIIENNRLKKQPYYIVAIGIFFICSLLYVNVKNTNFYKFCTEYYQGQYQAVDLHLQERVEYFEEHQGEDVFIEELPFKPSLTYFSDMFDDTEHLVNRTAAEYYGVKSISYK